MNNCFELNITPLCSTCFYNENNEGKPFEGVCFVSKYYNHIIKLSEQERLRTVVNSIITLNKSNDATSKQAFGSIMSLVTVHFPHLLKHINTAMLLA